MKKVVSLFIVFVMAIFALSLAACGNVNEGVNGNGSNSSTKSDDIKGGNSSNNSNIISGGSSNSSGSSGSGIISGGGTNENKKVYYTLTISIIGQGTVTGSSAAQYEKGSIITLTGNPDTRNIPAYKFYKFTDQNGYTISTLQVYSFNIYKNTSIVCHFVPNYRVVPSEEKILQNVLAEKLHKQIAFNQKSICVGLGGHIDTDVFLEYKVRSGILYSDIWSVDVTSLKSLYKKVDETTVTSSVKKTLSIGLKVGSEALSFSLGYDIEKTIEVIKNMVESSEYEKTWNCREYDPNLKYKLVIIADYDIIKVQENKYGFLYIGHSYKEYYYIDNINRSDMQIQIICSEK